jgi:hypothetical protein
VIYIIENLLPIFVAACGGLLAGTVYLNAAGRVSSMTDSAKVRSIGALLVAFVAEFWIASILAGALILAPEEAGEWAMAIGTAFILWVGFIAPAMVVNHRYEGRGWGQTGIKTGHWLLVLVVQAVLLQSLGVEGPGT